MQACINFVIRSENTEIFSEYFLNKYEYLYWIFLIYISLLMGIQLSDEIEQNVSTFRCFF